ncbi:hypothetical protein GC197_15380 [bacterium]|nr:hypothetical protein [bacterium]
MTFRSDLYDYDCYKTLKFSRRPPSSLPLQNPIITFELPCSRPVEGFDVGVLPPIPPYVPDDESGSGIQPCSRCFRLIEVGDPGFSYCTNCFGVIVVDANLVILQAGCQWFICPVCEEHLSEDDFEHWQTGDLSCPTCGCKMTWQQFESGGFQLLEPGEEELWPLEDQTW